MANVGNNQSIPFRIVDYPVDIVLVDTEYYRWSQEGAFTCIVRRKMWIMIEPDHVVDKLGTDD